MQFRHPVAPIRFSDLFVLALACGVGAGCGDDRAQVPPPSGGAGDIAIDPDAPSIAGFTAIGSCAMQLPACDGASNAPCTLSCATREDGCVSYSEYVPLETNADEAYSLLWGPIDPAGRWAFYRRDLTRGPRESTLYRWSADAGDVALAELLGLPPASPDVHEALVLLEVGADGDAILLLGLDDDVANHGYVWTSEAGLARLDFVPWDMSADGRVVVGSRAGRAVVWDREAGVRRLDGAELDAPPLIVPGEPPDPFTQLTSVRWIRVSDSGERVLSVENSGDGFRWTAAAGTTPIDGLSGFPNGASVELADLESGTLIASTPRSEREPFRLFWWSEGAPALEIGTLPGENPPFRRSASLLRAAGDVVIGDQSPTYGSVIVYRWSAELGPQRVSPALSVGFPLYANADGTTIVGTSSVGPRSDTFRWTATTGTILVAEGVASPLVALAGDVIVAPTVDSDPAAFRVLKFDRALDTGEALPLELIAARTTPARDAVETRVHALSENARLLAGTTLDAAGVTRAWVLAFHDSCDGL